MNLRTGWSKEIWKGVCNNMASIRERNGKFNVIYSYTNEKGERKQKWETYETKAEAKRRKKKTGRFLHMKEMSLLSTTIFFRSLVMQSCQRLKVCISRFFCMISTAIIISGQQEVRYGHGEAETMNTRRRLCIRWSVMQRSISKNCR